MPSSIPIGRIIVVEGPPGTGKSHTITAIAADCALKGKSCLILSDKTEALNVVQTKLSDTMSQVRHSKDFLNPILRLGQDQANFKKLTSQQALTQITAYVRAAQANQQKISGELTDTRDMMKDRIDRTVGSLGILSLREIAEFYLVERDIEDIDPALAERLRTVDASPIQTELQQVEGDEATLKIYLVDVFKGLSGASDVSRDVLEQQLVMNAATATSPPRSMPRHSASSKDAQASSSQSVPLVLEYDQLKMPILWLPVSRRRREVDRARPQ